jgi:hypothetical protein
MVLKLIGYKDSEYNYYPIEPISSLKQTTPTTNTVIFDIYGPPIPFGLLYVYVDNDNNTASIRIGEVQEYCFTLHAECGKFGHGKHVIPLNGRYIAADSVVDYKCEKLSTTEDIENAIQVTLNNEVVYFSKPHCVGHGQLKRPVLLEYPL